LLEATPAAQAFATVAPARQRIKNHKAEAKGDLSCRPSIRQCALLYEAWVTAEIIKHRIDFNQRLRTLGKEQQTQSEISKSFSGPVAFANDLDCFPVR
jgi:hypothetical protein